MEAYSAMVNRMSGYVIQNFQGPFQRLGFDVGTDSAILGPILQLTIADNSLLTIFYFS